MASLARPSPSSTTMSRRGRPRRRTMASGATASVGATMAPSTKPTASGMPSTKCATAATAQAGEDDAAEREQRDRAQVEAEFAPAHGDAGRIDQRRQNAEQHQFRRQLDPRQAGNERERDAGDDEQNRRRGVEPPRRRRRRPPAPPAATILFRSSPSWFTQWSAPRRIARGGLSRPALSSLAIPRPLTILQVRSRAKFVRPRFSLRQSIHRRSWHASDR